MVPDAVAKERAKLSTVFVNDVRDPERVSIREFVVEIAPERRDA
jgi:hypothetical protein